MDIFKFALEMETTAKDHYRLLAHEAPNKGLAIVFTMLADEEVKHYWVISQMQTKSPVELAHPTIVADAKEVFSRMARGKEKFGPDTSQIDLYRKAQDVERKSRIFYAEQCRQATGEHQKKILGQLADEEDKHYALLESIIEFVSRPQQWLENAEWHHLEKY